MFFTLENLTELPQHLTSHPGHESVRIDALVGKTIFECKSNLRRESADAEEQLTRYFTEREAATRERYTDIATDGVMFTGHDYMCMVVELEAPTRDGSCPYFFARVARLGGLLHSIGTAPSC